MFLVPVNFPTSLLLELFIDGPIPVRFVSSRRNGALALAILNHYLSVECTKHSLRHAFLLCHFKKNDLSLHIQRFQFSSDRRCGSQPLLNIGQIRDFNSMLLNIRHPTEVRGVSQINEREGLKNSEFTAPFLQVRT